MAWYGKMGTHSIGGVDKVQKMLAAMSPAGRVKLNATIGYSQTKAPYAIYVHEDLTKHHPTGQAKFLEAAYQIKFDEALAIIRKSWVQKKALEPALRKAAELIKTFSQTLVPVDTGNLKNSAYIRITDRS